MTLYFANQYRFKYHAGAGCIQDVKRGEVLNAGWVYISDDDVLKKVNDQRRQINDAVNETHCVVCGEKLPRTKGSATVLKQIVDGKYHDVHIGCATNKGEGE